MDFANQPPQFDKNWLNICCNLHFVSFILSFEWTTKLIGCFIKILSYI